MRNPSKVPKVTLSDIKILLNMGGKKWRFSELKSPKNPGIYYRRLVRAINKLSSGKIFSGFISFF